AQDEFGVEVLARLQSLRGDDGERRRLPRGYLDERGDFERVAVGARLRVNGARLSGDDDAAAFERRAQHRREQERGARDGDALREAAVVNRHRAANLNRVLSERAVDAQLARHAALCGSRAVNDVDERSCGADGDTARVADARAGLYSEVNGVVIDGER